METDKDIAGVYEAAMGTAGKQLSSMKRYADDLKIAFGEAFQPVMRLIIEQMTDSLKSMGNWFKDNKQTVRDWAANLLEMAVTVKAELIRISMLTDKAGGTMTSAGMLLYGPGRLFGNKNSTEKFNKLADANMDYEARYNAKEQELQGLATWLEGMLDKIRNGKDQKTRSDNFSGKGGAAGEIVTSLEAAKKAAHETSDEFKRMWEVWDHETPQHGELATKLLLWEDVTKLVNELTGQAKIDEFNQKLKDLTNWAEAFPERSDEATRAIRELTDNFNSADVAKLKEYRNAIQALEDETALLNRADKDLLDMEKKIREGRSKLEDSTKALDLAQRAGNQAQITMLQKIIELQNASIDRMKAQKEYMETLAVLSGQIVGFSNGQAIYANQGGAFNNGNVVDPYKSYNQTAAAAVGKNYWGEDVDKNGNVINPFGMPTFIGSRAIGAVNIQRTGFALVHEGERITPASQNSGATFGDITINVNGVDKSPDQIAREIVPSLQKYMGRMAA
jgi:hypothetical protein